MLEHSSNLRSRRRVPLLTACGVGLSLGLTVLAGSPAVADPTVTSTTLTATPSVTVGDAVTVDLDLAGVTDVYAYEVRLTFDPALLEYSSGGESGPRGGFDSLDPGDGTVTLTHSRLGTSPSLSGDLDVTVSLTAVGSGDGTVEAAVTLVDADGTTLQTTPTPATVQVARVVVPPTQEPSTSVPVTTPPTTPAAGLSPDPATTTSSASGGGSGTAPTATAGGTLPSTGFGAAALVLTAAAAVTAGVVLRRRSAGAR